jgi:hypothetical protein
LSKPQRTRAVEALQKGDAPTDPAILAAGIRFGTVWEKCRQRNPSWSASRLWWLPVLWCVLAVFAFVTGDMRRGATYLALAAFIAASGGWNFYVARRVAQHLGVLRATAKAVGAQLITADELPELPPRRRRLWVVLVLLGGEAVWPQRPRPECRTADPLVRLHRRAPRSIRRRHDRSWRSAAGRTIRTDRIDWCGPPTSTPAEICRPRARRELTRSVEARRSNHALTP